MKYKVGNKVRVREGLKVGDGFGCTTAVEDMLKYRGKITTIKEARSSAVGNYTIYEIDDDGEFWAWTDEMLEPAHKDTFKDCLDSAFEAWRKLGGATSLFHENTISIKEDKPMKFTFYVTEGTRVDKSCNGTIPTMTTTVVDASGKKATVTCDKVDYSERQGVLEAIAQLACGGNFDKEYDKAAKKNKLIELHDRTCTYCGKVFDTVEELKAHEAWHVERKKARRERYLLRKRAKEIAFEEQAQKMAKEMMDAEKGAK